VWETTVNGRLLHFHLAGINNQNFIMRDDETGSWWQQVSGEAISGPLKGTKLRSIDQDELTFAEWKKEEPNGRVLKPDPTVAANDYVPSDWEVRMARARVASLHVDQTIPPRTLVVGLTVGNASKAYPFESLVKQSPIIDEVGGVSVVVVVGKDGKSVRAFERIVDGRKLEMFSKTGTTEVSLVDAETQSEWDFSGKAFSGLSTGRQLKKIPVLMDYWFDWKNYHEQTALYTLGQ
jgi:hypothetical protein